MKKLLNVTILLLLMTGLAFAQLSFQLFNSSNSGLPYERVYCIDFDRNGNVWFGGYKGGTGIANVSMLAADLTTWKVYDQAELALPEDRVFYMAEDIHGNMWFCTHYGLSVLYADGTAKLIAFTNDAYTRTVQTDKDGKVYLSIRVDADRTQSRTYVSADSFKTMEEWEMSHIGLPLSMSAARPEIYDLKYDSKGQQWLCTYFGVTCQKADGTRKSIQGVEGAYTYAMTIDKRDHVWVPDNGTSELYEILPDETVIKHSAADIAPLSSKVLDLEADRNGHVWCATNGAGLLEIKPDGSFTQYTSESTGGALPENALTLLEIKDDVIWVATGTKGIVRITGAITGVEGKESHRVVERFELSANYPNPFNPVTTISFSLPKPADITLSIYDMTGKLVKNMAQGACGAGTHTVIWDGKDRNGDGVSSGVYLYALTAQGATAYKKMTLLK